MNSTQPSLIGAAIGNYRIVSPLGEGGMGMVYLAEHPLIGKRVALKVLHQELSQNLEMVTRFFNEARAVNEIGHPNIIDILDFGQVAPEAGGWTYLIMEYLDGASLAGELRERGPMEPWRAVLVAQQIADALAASHAHGIVHRDLKPDNVFLLSRSGQEMVKVLDFGIAKLCGGARSSARTRTGIVMGTPAYMSPEQCEGRADVDGRTDVYALGVLLFEMLTGRTPFVAAGYGEMIIQHLTIPPPAPSSLRPDVPAALDAIVARALAKRAEQRFASMAEMVAALRDPAAFLAGAPLTPAPVEALPMWQLPPESGASKRPTTLGTAVGQRKTIPGRTGAQKKRRRGLLVGALAGAVAVAVAIAVTMIPKPGPDPQPGKVVAPPVPQPQPPAPVPVPVAPPPVPQPVPPVPETQPPVPPPAPTSVTLTVNTPAKGAHVFVDGTDRGPAGKPITIPIGDKPLKVVVKAPGFKPYERTFTPRADKELDIELIPARQPPHPPVPQPQTCPADDPDCILPLGGN